MSRLRELYRDRSSGSRRGAAMTACGNANTMRGNANTNRTRHTGRTGHPDRTGRIALVIGPILVIGVVIGVAVALNVPSAQPQRDPEPIPQAAQPMADDLVAAREAAGIAACPESDRDVSARADGLPDISLPCIDRSSEVRLAGLRGKPMIINIWATWCGPCRQEAPHLAAYAQMNRDQVQFLGIDVADPDPSGAMRFAQFSQWGWPQLVDRSGRIRESYGPMIPQTLFVTAEGKVAHRLVGPVESIEQLQDLSARHLGVA